MKKQLLIVATIVATSFVYAQEKDEGIRPTIIPVTYHGETGRLDQYRELAGTVNEITKTEKIGYHPKEDWILNESVNPNALPKGEDPVLQKDYSDPAPVQTKAATYDWEGITNQPVSPGDPSVDVGPNHVVQMVNGSSGAYIQVYDKVGNTIGAQVYFDNFMGMPGGSGDPIVIYDERADRWLLSEFASAGNVLHVAISITPDPAGAYHTYTYTTANFPDYPKYSVWEDSYIVTTNESNSRIYVLDRTSMLAGTSGTAQVFNMTNFGTIGFQAATPVSLNGTTSPPAGAPAMVMRMRDDAWAGAASDALEIWDLNIDWAVPANSSLAQNATLLMGAPFDSELCGYTSFSCIDQPGSNTNLDPLRELLMNRIHYRNFGSHESMVMCHVTDVDGTDHAGLRWYEVRRTGGAVGAWSIYQEGTYSPDGYNRWMPSIGISATGNIGLAYNLTGTVGGVDVFPSLYYTGRKECDPLGVMTEPETVIVNGSAPSNSNRYGDYNAMGLDPSDGETFYFTGMYNPAASWSTRIAAFTIAACGANIAFASSTYDVDESSANVANGCLDYVDLSVPISIASAPTQDADVIVSVTGGTATSTVDFDILNTNHTLNGANLTGSVTIRVYNDDYVEGPETIILGYTFNANGGDASPSAINQTVTITINDDDLDPTNSPGPTVTIFSEDFNSGIGGFTTVNNGNAADTPWQLGDDGTVPNGAYTITPNGTPYMWIDDDDCNCDQSDVDLIFPSVDLSSYVTATLNFDTYFGDQTYQGDNENADLYVSVNGAADVLIGALVPSAVGGAWVTQNFDVSPYVGNNSVIFKVKYSDAAGWLYGCTVDDVLLTGQGSIAIQTVVNTGAGHIANLGPNETVHLYDPATGNVMMSLINTSGFDYGCVTVEVDRQGAAPTAMQFNTANTPDFLHSKTFTVVPTNINAAGTFDVMLYYEEAEVLAWEAATGNVRANAEIVKVDGLNQINDVNPGNFGSFTISSNPATLGVFSTDVTFTTSFNGLQSGLGVGIYTPAGGVVITANFSAAPTSVCEGGTVSFTDLSTDNPTSWTWDFGDGGSSSAQNPAYVYNTAGVYTVTLTATNSLGSDVEIQSSLITVVAASATSQNVALCTGETVTVGASTYSSAGVFTDVLTNAIGCDSTVTTTVTMLAATASSQTLDLCEGASVTVGGSIYTTTGTYTDVLTNAAGCDSTVTTNLTVNQIPSVDMTPAIIDTMCRENSGAPITLIGTPAGGTFSGPGVTGSVYDPAIAGVGTHTITYSYTDGNGCSSSVEVISVIQDCAAITENGLDGVVLFPNPTDGQFTISGLEIGTEYEIFDNNGKLVAKGTVQSSEEKVELLDVETGIYHLRSSVDGQFGSVRFLIAK
jgi:PKD repeat protein